VGTVTGVTGSLLGTLLPCPQSYAKSVQTIGPMGGTIVVGPHRFVVPPNALATAVTITAVAPEGNEIGVLFSPSGLKFNQTTTLSLSYASCPLSLVNGLTLHMVYTDDAGTTILSLIPSLQDVLNQRVNGSIGHFSRYALAY